MNDKLDKAIMDQFPDLYVDRNKPPSESLLCFGFECSSGWAQLITSLSKELTEEAKNHPDDPPVKAQQVKSKFGGLRFYYDGGGDWTSAIVAKYEDLSYTTCEDCGRTDAKDTNIFGWTYTLCPDCTTKMVEARKKQQVEDRERYKKLEAELKLKKEQEANGGT